MVGFYSSIPREVGLRTLREALDKIDGETIATVELLKMPEFQLKNNYSKFGNKTSKKISITATGTKFVSL